MNDETHAPLLIYENEHKSVEVRLDTSQETVWLTQRQMGEVFDTSPENVLMHLQNIYADEELPASATTKDFLVVRQEGKRRVRRELRYYNLEAIISVGYRVNSKRAVQFRQWVTRILREHLIKGWTLSRQRFETNAQELDTAMKLLRQTAQSTALDAMTGRGLVDIATRYAQTFLLLQRYDEGLLTEPRAEAGGRLPSLAEARKALADLKAGLVERGEATDLFDRERGDGLDALLANLDQSVFGESAYPTIEAKAAHLLYFVIKNHPFADGNKRSAAFLFVDFLYRNDRLVGDSGDVIINDVGLAALTLLVAESDPANKDMMI